ncbi:MAG: methyl-accepting chemotaxis protein [Proteobacteria bacterium]|nr:methyl-accepting chemotaxis protein [Pseudomonadota bacterium]
MRDAASANTEKTTPGSRRTQRAAHDVNTHEARAQLQEMVRVLALYQGPGVWVLGAVLAFFFPAWQWWLLLGVLGITELFYIWSWLDLRADNQGDRPLRFAMLANFITCLSVIVFLDGMAIPAMLSIIMFNTQVAFFSSRIPLTWVALGILAAFADVFLRFYPVVERVSVTPVATIVAVTIGTIIMLTKFGWILRGHRKTTMSSFSATQKMLQERQAMLRQVAAAQSHIHAAVAELAQHASDVAAQAAGQAAAISQVSATMTEVAQTAQNTARSADESKDISQRTSALIEANHKRLQSAESTFGALSQQMEGSYEVFGELLERVEQAGAIISATQTIGEHIKVLSVNAAIEAAEAGEKGRGFSVVAQELRELIGDTEKNNRNSQSILSDVRSRSRQTMTAMNRSLDLLGRFSQELVSTSQTLEMSMASFSEASLRMHNIAAASAEQQIGLKEINSATWDIQSASSQLEAASLQLQKVIKVIQTSSADLSALLQVGSVSR